MRLSEIEIKNFRKLKNCHIKFRDATFLIGQNNAGKSSVFAAIDCLHKSSQISRDDFMKVYDKVSDDYVYCDQVEIVARYANVPVAATEWVGFSGRVIDKDPEFPGETRKFVVYKKVWSIKQNKPQVYMLEYPRVRSSKYSSAKKISDLIGDDFDRDFLISHFGEDDLEKSLGVAALKSKLNDLGPVWDVDSAKSPLWVENPGGIPGNVLSKLPRVVVVPAESCAAQLTGAGGTLGALLGELFEEVRKKSTNFAEAQKYLNLLARELDPKDVSTDFGKLLADLNGMAHSLFPDSAVHVSAALDQPDKSIKPQFSVEMESNVRTPVSYQGHGMIRATAFQLLRFVHDFVNKGSAYKRTTIFCFEEPEIYLHPAAANQMRDSIYDLAGPGCQIVATTHSPYMINLGTDKNVSLTKFSFDEEGYSRTNSFNLEAAFNKLAADEKLYLKMQLKVDDYVSRMFFAKKTVFFEGDTEEVVLRETLRRLSAEDRARVVGACEFIRGRGKAVFVSMAKYLNVLGLDYVIVHDRDKGVAKAEEMNAHILAAAGSARQIMLEECVEDVLGYPPPGAEKPYAAFRYINSNWGSDFDSIPKAWRDVFVGICAPYLNHLSAKAAGV